MADDGNLGRSTRSGLSYVQRLLLHMIDQDLRRYRFANRDVTFDFTTLPFGHARGEKILKAIRHWSEADDDDRVQFFHFHDEDLGRDYIFTFRLVDEGRYVQVDLLPDGDGAPP